MRDSEIACDSCGLTMGESRKLATLRAQADARPAGHFFKASRVHPWVQVEKECPNAVPLYTHPEASAPGLIDQAIAICQEEGDEWDSDRVQATKNYAHACRDRIRALTRASAATVAEASKLAVWYGPMPESNGKTNWTAILHNGDITKGITLDRSEFPDRVRYEADRARFLIGELKEAPFILDYDANKCDAAQQQAEPGADERAAHLDLLQDVLDAKAIMLKAGCKQDAFAAMFAEYAAQSGQRAGVAEAAKVLPFAVLDALRFYANGSHFCLADETAWDTVSGEPQNFWCDEAGTATVEDGSIAKAVLQGVAFTDGDNAAAVDGEVYTAQVIAAAPTQQKEGGDV